jgi:monoamine oxidase
MVDASGHDAVEWVLRMLGEAIGHPLVPSGSAVSSWSTDPYCGGAYTHVPPGASPAEVDLLGEPIHGRVLFAGEHTQSVRTGYADGAMTSGIREAKRPLDQSAVGLGRLAH